MAFTTGDNNFGTAKWIVDATAGQGTHTTIAAALTAASSGQTIFIRPGTYTENLTLKAGVNLTAYEVDSYTPNVTIVGKCTLTTAGTVSMSGLYLKTNADFFLAVTGSAASVVNLVHCFLDCHDNTGISYTSSSASSSIDIEYCNYLFGTNATAFFSMSGAGSLSILSTESTGSVGASSAASTCSAGTFNLGYSTMVCPVTISGTGNISASVSTFSMAGVNATCVTMGGATSEMRNCTFLSGSASAISVGVGSTLNLDGKTTISSSNTNAITGAGTIKYSDIDFFGTSSAINTTTIQNFNASIPSISASGGTAAITIGSTGVLTLSSALPVTSGGTGLTSTTTSQILYSSGTSVIAGLATANNGVLITSGGGVPSISSTLPSAVQGNITAVGTLASFSSAPAASQSSSLSLGAAYQNPFGYDVVLTIYINITVNTTGSITCGVGPTNTPTAQTLLSGLTTLGFFPVTVYLPKSYYALITATSITATIVGQQALPV